MPADTPAEVAAVTRLIRGVWISMSVRAMVELGVAEALGTPSTLAELAAATSADAQTLARLLRVLTDLGLVEPAENGRYALTSWGETLRPDHPSGMRDLALMQTWPPNVSSWTQLTDAVRSGSGTFAEVNGSSHWETLGAHPDQEAIFNATMARRGTSQAEAITQAFDLTGVDTIVDVGGGKGALLASLLTQRPQLQGVLADQPDVVARAEPVLAAAGVDARCRVVGVDFFESVPDGGDVYVLANILHDWTDHEATAILGVLRTAMRPGARLLILERVLDGDANRSAEDVADLHLMDLNMLVLFGARERTTQEYDDLLQASGFRDAVVHRTRTPWNVVEATRA